MCPENGPSCVIPLRRNAQCRRSAAHYRQHVPSRECAVQAECCALSATLSVQPPRCLRSAACCPFPTSMPTPPGQQAPLASSTFRLDCLHTNLSTSSVDQHAEACPRVSSLGARCFIPLRRVHMPNFSRRSCRLHVLLRELPALIFGVEYPLNFPFSSAILIGGTGYLYYRSSRPSPGHRFRSKRRVRADTR
jgi:hypothetical protein